MIMPSNCLVVAELILIDGAIFALFRRLRRARAEGSRRLFLALTVALMGLLVHAAPFVCSADVAIAPITLGGLALVQLAMSDETVSFRTGATVRIP
jgi:hypothetical protein